MKKRTAPQLKIKEAALLQSVMQWLRLRGVFHWRNNSGAIKTQSGRFISFGYKGSADIIAIDKGRMLMLECKSSTGRQSPAQKAFQLRFEREGGVYVLLKPDNWIEQLEGLV
jgi:hypothetical protein